MSPEERQLLTGLFDRVRTAAATPRDREAETFIDQGVREQPYTTYYLAQAVIVQEKGLEAAANHIKELEERIRQLEAGESEHHQAEQGGGFLSSIFGTGQAQQPAQTSGPWGNAPRQAQQDRGYDEPVRPIRQQQPSGPWDPQPGAPSAGGSFLRGALGTAAGVAGGMLLANSLSGIFGNHMSSLGWGSPFSGSNPFGNASAPAEETVINNYYGDQKPQADDDNNNNDNDIRQADYKSDDDVADDQSGDDSFDV
ncbi:DUF2076 domain-containing protein [Rhizobium sullae]|uniref:DUF2076 domain-containing protein n=1 Tax=Rhizobium sullae TaxID=50338 RepID=A0A2N0D568_RHISU|nr:DUF2076 domain-containing protein [Rhizobium sullae]PKA41245.1 DUF2076 domain-containing protein [Rhizobium sullae]UWU12851.1 DUF2076 domain-containing protein [Rhizobium sullae]